jgi:hypothetical protein
MAKGCEYPARTMPLAIASDRRRDRRYSLTAKLRGKLLSGAGLPREQQAILAGHVQDISSGGLCVLSSRPVKNASVVHCELSLPQLPVRIRALMRVRWMKAIPRKAKYRLGLQFLL